MRQVSLTAHVKHPGWQQHAACRGLDANLFHPMRGEDTSGAKRVCQACPVRRECLAFALVTYEKHGIWGGMSERERRVIRGQLTKAGLLHPPLDEIDHGTPSGYHAHRRRHEKPCRLCLDARNASERKLAESA